MPLLNDDRTDLNDRAYFIFNQMFDKYSIVDPKDESRRIMGVDEVIIFVQGATKELCNRNDNRVSKILGFDSNADGLLERHDFIEFYRQSCFAKIEVVRQNLTHHNYRHDLKQAPIAGQDDNIL